MAIQQFQNGGGAVLAPPRRLGRGVRRGYGLNRATSRASATDTSANPYLAFALQWWWLLLAGLVIGLAAAFAYVRYGPIPYQSSALILVPPQIDPAQDTLGSSGAVRDAAENFAAQAASPYMYDLVSRDLQGKFAIDVLGLQKMVKDGEITVRAQRGSNLINVTASDTNPETARLLADTFARVFVADVNKRTGTDVATRKKQLEERIETVRQQLTASQLQQQEQDLSKEVWNLRSQLLQIQAQYQQELQRQIMQEQQQLLVAITNRTGVTPAQQQQVQALQQVANASAAARQQSIQAKAAQQQELEQKIQDLTTQLNQVQEDLAKIPVVSQEELTQQQQRAQLKQREQVLDQQLRDQRSQLLQIQARQQQELQRQAADRAQGQTTPPGVPTLTPQQQAQQDQIRSASAAAGNQALLITMEQERDVERGIVDTQAQLMQIREALAQLPPEADAATSIQGQTAQRDQQSQRTQLERRQQDLTREIQSQRALLLQTQAQQQQETVQQLEERRQSLLGIAAASGAGQPATQPASSEQLAQLTGTASTVRTEWLNILSEQQKAVDSAITAASARLQKVREALAATPAETDPLLSAAFATAYGEQLQALTQQFARLEMNAQALTAPIERFGSASEPLPSMRSKRTLFMGTGAGLGVAAGLAYGLDLLRQRRQRAALLTQRPPRQWATLVRPGDPAPSLAESAEARQLPPSNPSTLQQESTVGVTQSKS